MIWPKRFGELLAMIFFMCMIIIVFSFEVFVVRPYLIENNYRFVPLHLMMAIVIFINTWSNLYKVIKTETSTIGIVMPSSLMPEWHYCNVCEANSPPRSFHCNICDRCILRRDHHCVFTACCIGYKNYKYFMGLLFQVAFACIYASIMHSSYVWSNMNELSSLKAFGAHCLPLIFFMFGVIDLWTMFCNIISMLCIIGVLFTGGLFGYHFNLLLKDQTTFERTKSIHKYGLKNWKLNLYTNLGDRWLLTIFCSPHIASKLPGDGIYFSYKHLDEKQF